MDHYIATLEESYVLHRDSNTIDSAAFATTAIEQITSILQTALVSKPADGELMLQQVLKRLTDSFGPDDPCTLAVRDVWINYLCTCKTSPGLEEAGSLMQNEYLRQVQALGLDDPKTLQTRNTLAELTWTSGDAEGAVQLLEDEWKRQITELGEDDMRTIKTRNVLVDTLYWTGNPGKAENLLAKEFKRQLQVLGTEDPRTRGTKNKFEEVCRWQDKKAVMDE